MRSIASTSDQRRKTRQAALSAGISGGGIGGKQTSAEYTSSMRGGNMTIGIGNKDLHTLDSSISSLGSLGTTDRNGRIRLLEEGTTPGNQREGAERRPSTPAGCDVVEMGAAFAYSATHRWGRRSRTPPKTPLRSQSTTPVIPTDLQSPASPLRYPWSQNNAEEAYSRRRGWRNSNGIQEGKVHRERPVRLLLGLKKGPHAIKDLLAEVVVDDGVVAAISRNLGQSRFVPFQLKEGDAKIIQKSGKSNAGEGLFDEALKEKKTERMKQLASSGSKRNPFAATHLDHFFFPAESPRSDYDGGQQMPTASAMRIPPPQCLSDAGVLAEEQDFSDRSRTSNTPSRAGHSRTALGYNRQEGGERDCQRPSTSAGVYTMENVHGPARPFTSPSCSPRRGRGQRGSTVDEFFIPRSPDKGGFVKKASPYKMKLPGGQKSLLQGSRKDLAPTFRAKSSPGLSRGMQISSLRMPPRSSRTPDSESRPKTSAAPAEHFRLADRGAQSPMYGQPLLEPWSVTLTPQSSGLRMG